MDMRTHLHQQVNNKVSRFIVGEEGKVGSRSAFTAAAFIGATSLAGILLGPTNAKADGGTWVCDGDELKCHDTALCCHCFDANLNADYHGCTQDTYDCRVPDFEPGLGMSCWFKP